MVLTQGWANGLSIGIVAVAVARLWKWPSWWKRYRAHRKSTTWARWIGRSNR